MRSKNKSLGVLSISCLLLSGCETTNPQEKLNIQGPVSSLKANKAMQPQVTQAFLLLKEGKYTEASSFINMTLQTQPQSMIFHVLNALTYEKLAEAGDPTAKELAIVGYHNALSIDPFNSFVVAQLAKLKYRDQKFDEAQELFAQALLIKPNDPDLIHEFAAASYYAYDIKAALSAIKRVIKATPDDPLVHRSAAMIYAAVGDFKTSEKHFKLLQTKLGEDPEVTYVANRFNDWQHLYKTARLTLAQATPSDSASSDSASSDSASSQSSGSGSSSSGGSGRAPSSAPAPGLTVDQPPQSQSDSPTAQQF